MSSNHHTDDVFKRKKKPKNPIKFNIQLNQEQKEAKQKILENTVTIIKGSAGSGKTLTACQVALDLLFTKQVEHIRITRPTVSDEELGFLPGDINEKMDPWVDPIYDNLFLLYNRNVIEKNIAEKVIEIVPFSYMRGKTFTDSVVIVDEAQNVTDKQMQKVLGRTGNNTKIIICGDQIQNDLHNSKQSGLNFTDTLSQNIKGVDTITLKKNHRHPIVEPILKLYETYGK